MTAWKGNSRCRGRPVHTQAHFSEISAPPGLAGPGEVFPFSYAEYSFSTGTRLLFS